MEMPRWVRLGLIGSFVFTAAMAVQGQQPAAASNKVAIVVCADAEDPEGLLVEELSPPDALMTAGEGDDCGSVVNALLREGFEVDAVNVAPGPDQVIHVVYSLESS